MLPKKTYRYSVLWLTSSGAVVKMQNNKQYCKCCIILSILLHFYLFFCLRAQLRIPIMLCYCICRLKPFYFTEPPRVVVFLFFFRTEKILLMQILRNRLQSCVLGLHHTSSLFTTTSPPPPLSAEASAKKYPAQMRLFKLCRFLCVCVCLLPLNPLRFLTRLCDENIKMSRKKKSIKKKKQKCLLLSPVLERLLLSIIDFKQLAEGLSTSWCRWSNSGHCQRTRVRPLVVWAGGCQCPGDHSHTLITFRFNQ